MEEESLFLKYIRATLKKWVGFQVAIDEGMGGPYAREKEMWLSTEIEKYFKTYSDVKPGELEDYVGIMIDNEFDTYFEDGSLFEICKLFCNAYSMSEDPNAPIFRALKEVPAASSGVSNSSQSGKMNTVAKTDAATDSVEATEENVATQLTALEIKDADHQSSENDGWTVVNRKHNKQNQQTNKSATSN